jgi:hypothetical protein
MCAVVRLRALMAHQSARLITNRPIEGQGCFVSLGAGYTSDLVCDFMCDFMCDLLQIAGAISCPQCSHSADMKLHLRSAFKSHMKLHTCNQPLNGKQTFEPRQLPLTCWCHSVKVSS